MATITLSVPEAVKQKMARFSEINWSGFIREVIVKKTEELSWKEEMLKKLREEEGMTEWALALQHKARKDRVATLRKKGLIA